MVTRAATRSPRKKAAGRSGNSRRKLKPSDRTRGLEAADIALAADHQDIRALVERIGQAGGAAVGAYRDPLGGRALVLASLPIRAIQPTPFQRDLSPTHAKRLAEKIDQTAAFLDPLIVVLGDDDLFWTPNGRHRLAAAKVLGLKQITALISPDETLAYRILALNTEKAHNLKDRSLEVIRMARSLAQRQATAKEIAVHRPNSKPPELLTLGIVYEKPAALCRRRLQLVAQEGRPLQRPRPCRPSLREREGLRCTSAGDRHAR